MKGRMEEHRPASSSRPPHSGHLGQDLGLLGGGTAGCPLARAERPNRDSARPSTASPQGPSLQRPPWG